MDFIRKVFEAVHRVTWSSPSSDRSMQAMLRTLVTYCYARGLCRSSEIEFAAKEDPAIHYLCPSHPPTPEEVRRFRRANIKSLRQVLSILISPGEAEDRLMLAIKADSADLDV